MSAESEKNITQTLISGEQPRSPVVAVVGHVDHGKTTLLDYIRKTSIASKEVGGITQSIGAYEVEHAGKRITFIDTPGHEAFLVMRTRGATAADLAILVVAADEGVKPQTTEAIAILKQTKTPFIVALTKIDSPNANIEKVKNELLGAEVLLEGYGGNISWHGVSGITGEGVSELLDLITLAGEVASLNFDPEGEAKGFVLESKKDNRRGIIAHLILKDGILQEGETISTPTARGKIIILEDFIGRRVGELKPSSPASVVGFGSLPRAGEEFRTGEVRKESIQIQIAPRVQSETLEKEPRLRAILKADTSGSIEALEELLKGMIEIGEAAVGEISDNDVKFAKSTGSVIIGFKVEANKTTTRLADAQQVKIITSDIIYKLVEAVSYLIDAKKEGKVGATLEVLATFSATQTKRTVGGKVTEGTLKAGNTVQIERGEEVIGRGKITNLQHNKQDVKEVTQGSEFGFIIETTTPIGKGDFLRVV